jgi:hypothetical protein
MIVLEKLSIKVKVLLIYDFNILNFVCNLKYMLMIRAENVDDLMFILYPVIFPK